jgi:hypothetical protein
MHGPWASQQIETSGGGSLVTLKCVLASRGRLILSVFSVGCVGPGLHSVRIKIGIVPRVTACGVMKQLVRND